MQTYKLNNGVHVLARPLKDGNLYPYTYITRTQAENSARKHGGEVYQGPSSRRVFYVTITHDSHCPANYGCACYCDRITLEQTA
jgi:hypothetical protein